VVTIGLSGRDVVVFGATGALGAGVASMFASAGATVVGADRVAPPPERTLTGISYEVADAMDEDSLAGLFDAHNPPWAVINTIGGYAPARPLDELDAAELARQLQLNLVTAAVVTKHALRVMRPAGQGRIVHTASRAAVQTKGSGFAYSVSKQGVLHLVAMAAEEVRGSGITVNCVMPSIIDTPANRAAMPDADHDSWPKIPDVSLSYIYLASPDAGLVNGAVIPVTLRPLSTGVSSVLPQVPYANLCP
jgi:NAD(P)-dependent dehydrogenase (short-subunit alcohol dehydrogenase family)